LLLALEQHIHNKDAKKRPGEQEQPRNRRGCFFFPLQSASPQPGGLQNSSRKVGAKRRPPVSFECKQHPEQGCQKLRFLRQPNNSSNLKPKLKTANRVVRLRPVRGYSVTKHDTSAAILEKPYDDKKAKFTIGKKFVTSDIYDSPDSCCPVVL
jgi:hypothetical protein